MLHLRPLAVLALAPAAGAGLAAAVLATEPPAPIDLAGQEERSEFRLSWTSVWPERQPGTVAGTWFASDGRGDPVPGAAVRWQALASAGHDSPGRLVGWGEVRTDAHGLSPIRFRPRLQADRSVTIVALARDDLGVPVRAIAHVEPGAAGSLPAARRASEPIPALPFPSFLRPGDVPRIAGRTLDPGAFPQRPAGRSVGKAWTGELSRPVILEVAVPAAAAAGTPVLTVEISSTRLGAGVAAALALCTEAGRGSDVAAARLLAASAGLAGGAVDPAATLLRRASSLAIADLAKSQNADGGWGWWRGLPSAPDLTAFARRSLGQAKEAGPGVPTAKVASAGRYLLAAARSADPGILAAIVWALGPDAPRGLRDRAWAVRKAMSPAALGRLAEGLARAGDPRSLEAVALLDLRSIEEGDTARWQEVPAGSLAREWDGSDVEATAQAIRAHAAVGLLEAPVPEAVDWVLRNRRGQTWGGPRASAVAAAALADAGRRGGGAARNPQAVLDGSVAGRFLLQDKDVVVAVWDGALLGPGRHELLLRAGEPAARGAVTFAASLRYLDGGGETPALAHPAVEIRRGYSVVANTRLGRAGGRSLAEFCRPRASVPALRGRLPLDATAIVRIEVEVRQALRFARITDPLPAGARAVPLPPDPAYHFSPGSEEVVFDIPELAPGHHEFRYPLRPRVPGTYLAPPPRIEAVHMPEIRARAGGRRLEIGPAG